MEEAEAEAGPWQTKSRWQSELAEIYKSGDEERLRDLCGTFHLKRKHLEEPFARSFPEAIVLNSKLKKSQPRKVLLEQFTPLHLSCWHDNRTIVEALIHANDPFDHFVFDSSGRTPFKVCVDAGATGALAEMEFRSSRPPICQVVCSFSWMHPARRTSIQRSKTATKHCRRCCTNAAQT